MKIINHLQETDNKTQLNIIIVMNNLSVISEYRQNFIVYFIMLLPVQSKLKLYKSILD